MSIHTHNHINLSKIPCKYLKDSQINYINTILDPRGIFGNNGDLRSHPDGKYVISEQRDQHYATVRKPMTQSPCRDSAVLDRIPEYSEDIYPYATFHLPDQENMSGNPDRPNSGCGASKCLRSTNTAGRRGKKPFKSESEEYDSLGSDTDTGSVEHGSRTESSNQLDDPINFCGKAISYNFVIAY